jgi:hypothetical protein
MVLWLFKAQKRRLTTLVDPSNDMGVRLRKLIYWSANCLDFQSLTFALMKSPMLPAYPCTAHVRRTELFYKDLKFDANRPTRP